MTKLICAIVTLSNYMPHYCFCGRVKVGPVTLLPVQHVQMRPLDSRVICTLQIEYLSKAFSRIITRPALLTFPALQKHNIHHSASTRGCETKKRHIDGAGVVRCSSNSPRDSNDPNSFPSTAKGSASGATVPPIREQQSQLDNDPDSFRPFSEQSVQVSFNSVLGCAFSETINY